jgi:uncharacterized membrane protein YtjA (UPF0391 family)
MSDIAAPGAAGGPVLHAGAAPAAAALRGCCLKCMAPRHPCRDEEPPVLHYAVVFFVIALIAALLGFGGIAAGAAGIAKILFIVFLVMALVSFLVGITRRR